MSKPLSAFAITTFVAASGALAGPNAVRDLSHMTPDFSEMSDQGTQIFGVVMNAKSNRGSFSFDSKVTFNTSVKHDAVVLNDTWEIMGRTFECEFECQKDAFLSPEEGEITMYRNNQAKTASFSVEGEVAHVDSDGRQADLPFPTGTLSQAAAFRVIPQLPTQPNIEYVFSAYTEATELATQQPSEGENFSVVCKGDSKVSLGNEEMTCTEFVLNTNNPVSFFVDFNGQLRKVVADNGQTQMFLLDETGSTVAAVD